jgi:hypothetical protein
MGDAVEARADIKLGEAFKPAAEAQARIYRGEFGGTILLALIFTAGIIAGTTAGMLDAYWVPSLGSWPSSVLGLIGMMGGLVLALRVYARRHTTGFLAALRKLGSPELFPTRFRFDDEGLAADGGRVSHRIAWPAVLFVVPSREHWLVQADTLTLAVPRRAFADAAAEQAFLDLAEARMSEDARRRSVLKSH